MVAYIWQRVFYDEVYDSHPTARVEEQIRGLLFFHDWLQVGSGILHTHDIWHSLCVIYYTEDTDSYMDHDIRKGPINLITNSLTHESYTTK